MHNKPSLALQFISFALTMSVLIYTIRASTTVCYDRVIHREVDARCKCQTAFTGMDGECDSTSIVERYHEYCDRKAKGYWYCENRVVEVGWQAYCTTHVNWAQWLKCYTLSGLVCAGVCAVAKTSLSCLSCLAKFSSDCFGCGIRYCSEGSRFPLHCLQAVEGFPAVSGCP